MKISIPIAFLLAIVLSGRAATVTTTADNGPGSLREAIANATPGETINFSVSGTITLTSGELLIAKDVVISGPGAANLTVQRSTAAGMPDFRVFNVNSGIVTITGLTVANGRADVGGGIENETTFTLRDCVITGNSATERGGGINNLSSLVMSNCVVGANTVVALTNDAFGGGLNNAGTLTALSCNISSNSVAGGAGFGCFGGGINNGGTLAITNSMISGNLAAEGSGGGIFNQGTLTLRTSTVGSNSARTASGSALGGGIANGFGTVTLDRSTVSRNIAVGVIGGFGHGGGIFNDVGTVTVESSTVSGNSVQSGASLASQGAGLFNGVGAVVINHSTIAVNVASGGMLPDGGGLFNSGGVVEIKNTILAANAAAIDLFNDQFGITFSDGFNLIGSTNGPFALGTNDQFNVTAAQLKIGSLQDNDGPTFTHALLCGSPAIDAGDNTDAPATDQRGFPRIVRGVIDIGAYEDSNTAPTISCPGSITNCAPSTSQALTVSVNVADADGDPLIVVWIVDGSPRQTNAVAAGGPPTTARVDFTALFSVGEHVINVSVTDSKDCVATCPTTMITIKARGDLYPIALNIRNVTGVRPGDIIADIYNGVQPGNFGWLTWAGRPSEPTLVASLTPPGNSSTYVNPRDRRDHVLSVGDWVQGKPGISNSDKVRKALDTLEQIDIVVPVWDQATGRGNNSLYHVVAFARVRIVNYQLPKQNRITARFLGFVDCD